LLWLKAAIILYSESFFGDLHGQGHHAIEFFTQTKVVVERWRQNWSRQF
jgi:malonate-semialdehyde dehydrogenase (acetylating)/methylmalonate-semialdehyde dehydrogenase